MKSKAPGELLHTEKPFAHVISNKERGKRCDECLQEVQTGQLKRCSACHNARYCSTACQKSAWTFHKAECSCFQRVHPKLPSDSVLLFHRLLIRHERGENTKIKEEYLGKNRCFDDLMSHVEDIKQDHRRTEDFAELCYTLRLYLGEDFALPNSDVLMQIFGRMAVNTFSICDGEMQPIGAAIYLGVSILDHSCKPNAVAVFRGTELQLRATAPICNIDVEDIFISYTDLLSSSRDRQTELEQQYYFTCQCPVCEDEERELLLTAATCPTAGCNTPVHQDNEDDKFLPCPGCNKAHFPKDYHEQRSNAIMEAKFLLTKCKKWKAEGDAESVFGEVGEFLSHHGSVLHGAGVYITALRDCLMDAAIDTQRWPDAAQYAQENVAPYRAIYPENHPSIGIHLMKLGKILQFLEKLPEALKHLQQAQGILVITHGDDHPMVVQLREMLDACQEEMRVRRLDALDKEEEEENDD